MAHSLKDLVRVLVTGNPGTGTITTGAAIGVAYQALGAADDGNTFDIQVFDVDGSGNRNGKWEIQKDSTWNNTAKTFTRSSGGVLDGSSGPGLLVNFSSGKQQVIVEVPASRFLAGFLAAGSLQLPGAMSSSLQAVSDGVGNASSALTLATNNVLLQTLNGAGMPNHPPPGATQAAGGFRSYLSDGTTSVTLIGMATSNNVEIYPLAQGQLIFFGSAGYAGGPSPTLCNTCQLRSEDHLFSQNMQIIGTTGTDDITIGDSRNIAGNVQGDFLMGVKSGTFRFQTSGGVDGVTVSLTKLAVRDQGNSIDVFNVTRATGVSVLYSDFISGGNVALSGSAGSSLQNSGIQYIAPGVTGPWSGQTSARFFQNTGGEAMLASPFTRADNVLTTTNLAFPALSTRSYRLEGLLIVSNSTAGEGGQFDFNGGSATVSSFNVAFTPIAGTVVVGTTTATALNGVINYSTLTGTVYLYVLGQLTCNGAGTLKLRAAENSAHVSGTLTIAAGSWLALYDTVTM